MTEFFKITLVFDEIIVLHFSQFLVHCEASCSYYIQQPPAFSPFWAMKTNIAPAPIQAGSAEASVKRTDESDFPPKLKTISPNSSFYIEYTM